MRKTTLLSCALALSLCACNHKKTAEQGQVAQVQPKVKFPKGALPVLRFQRTSYNFGDIRAGDEVSVDFKFINIGKAPLRISNAYGSCGCTIPKYPKHPIAPGAYGKIKVTFNSAGKSGKQHKQVTLLTNTAKGQMHLDITANVIDHHS